MDRSPGGSRSGSVTGIAAPANRGLTWVAATRGELEAALCSPPSLSSASSKSLESSMSPDASDGDKSRSRLCSAEWLSALGLGALVSRLHSGTFGHQFTVGRCPRLASVPLSGSDGTPGPAPSPNPYRSPRRNGVWGAGRSEPAGTPSRLGIHGDTVGTVGRKDMAPLDPNVSSDAAGKGDENRSGRLASFNSASTRSCTILMFSTSLR